MPQPLNRSDCILVSRIESDVEFQQPRRLIDRRVYSGAQGTVCQVIRTVEGAERELAARKNLHHHLQSVAASNDGKVLIVVEMELLKAASGMPHMPDFLGAAQAEADDTVYLFYQPWCEFTLARWLAAPLSTDIDGPSTPSKRKQLGLQWMVCMAAAIYGLHAAQSPIIHRDLKPTNICITGTGHLCFVDFGVARLCKDDTVCSTYVGTEEYMAPEVGRASHYGRTSEVVSLACIYSEILTVVAGYNVDTGLRACRRNQPYARTVKKTLTFLKRCKPEDGSLDEFITLVEEMFALKPLDRPTLWEVHGRLLDIAGRLNFQLRCCATPLGYEDDKVPDVSTPPSTDELTTEFLAQCRLQQ
ncbi:kinase-like domain-containing protein [Fimicolochytrium jonesii]|uniref:kinase-like domain-containing protein n=1 Tax=Fimicolochytrium jonesii TaxID=1396493 RepID=UPI0022FF05AE|nr:kinase-like domain-containing protein [Fimicolochytrium jonesii]KAI8818149.1 kinase-like domain-containing protein [Fimicolochytrium jonesii]